MEAGTGPGAGPLAAVPRGGGVTGNERELGGPFMLGPWRVRRTGYGAMQLAGDGVSDRRAIATRRCGSCSRSPRPG